MALFDAYAEGFEYVQPAFIDKHHKLTGYVQHPKWVNMKPGSYTDDTQMALAIAELMLRKDPAKWTAYDVAETFTFTFKRDPREGYSGGFHNILKHITEGKEDAALRFLMAVEPHSEKNGGAMRAGPLGVLPSVKQVIDAAFFQATLTHATPWGSDAAVASALMVHYFYHHLGPKKDLPGFLLDFVPRFEWDVPWTGRVRSPGDQAVRAAMTAIQKSDTLIDVLRHCVNFGGDTDTVAAIAGCAAAVSTEIFQIMPPVLHRDLENGKYGRDYLQRIDHKLQEKYPPGAAVLGTEASEEAEDSDPIADLFS